jgi:uncharacterized membrane protein
LRRPDGGIRLFVLALAGLGLGLTMGVDLLTLKGDITRMNTVFKFYLHAWIAFALVAAFAAWQLLFVVWRPAFEVRARALPRVIAAGGVASLTALVLGALIYPLAATPARLDDRFADLPATLDGTEYMKTAVYSDHESKIDLSADYEGIQWLRRNVIGTPTIVEGRSELYRWGSRFSIYTGLPTVVGWDWHQKQQRGDFGFLVDQRLKQLDDFYSSTNLPQAARFIRQYDVQYVIVGQVERIYYPPAGLRKFETGLAGMLEVAYANPKLTIYRVLPEALQPAASIAPP